MSDDVDSKITVREPTSTSEDEEQGNAEKPGEQNENIPQNVPLKKGTIKDLNPTEIRWFYKPPVKNSSWIPFKGRDSLLIELKFRIQNQQALGEDFPDRETALQLCKSVIVVLDGYYELILEEMEVKPIYWKGDPMKIIRGGWFFETNWCPVTEKISQAVEEQHLKMFSGQKIPEGPVYTEKGQKPILHSLELEDSNKIEWNSIIDITMVTNRTWTNVLRLKSNVIKLRRGYHNEALMSDGPIPVNHLVFVVHGIGQKRQVNRIVMNAIGMRSVADRILEQKYKTLNYRPMFLPVEWRSSLKLDEGIVDAMTPTKIETVRALLNTTFMDIMYYNSPKYRSEVSDGLMMVLNKLYYKFMQHNPNFKALSGKISIFAHSLGSVISYDVITGWSPLQQYEDFVTQRLKVLTDSPIVNHISQEHLSIIEQAKLIIQSNQDHSLLKLMATAEAYNMRLAFKVDNLFCLGSPLGVFLALRGQIGRKLFEHNHLVLYNVFHPHDPIAYRLEPLVHPLYSKIRPLRIHRHDSKNPTPYAEMPMELSKKEVKRKASKDTPLSSTELAAMAMTSDDGADSDGRISPSLAVETTDKSLAQPPKKTWSFVGALSKLRGSTPSTNPAELSPTKRILIGGGASSSGSAESLVDASEVSISQVLDSDPLSKIPSENRLPYRVDYTIKESKLDYGILSTLTSHTSYWADYDVIAFLLAQIYGLPVDSDPKLDLKKDK